MSSLKDFNYYDIIGKKFGELEVVEFVGFKRVGRKRRSIYRCKCSCGNEKVITRTDLLSGKVKSCGHLWKSVKEDLTGQRFGRLVVLGRDKKGSDDPVKKRVFYTCKCDCGNVVPVYADNLKRGKTQSCGCITVDRMREANSKYGEGALSGSALYKKWSGMMARCYNEKSSGYDRYGGRGIKVCERWHDFLNFYNDMIDSYNNQLEIYNGDASQVTIERIDSDGDYCPENCTWATPKQQNRNKCDNVFVYMYGKKMCLSEAVELYSPADSSYDTIRSKLKKDQNQDIYDLILNTHSPSIQTDVIKPLEFLRPDQDWRDAYTEDELKGFTN